MLAFYHQCMSFCLSSRIVEHMLSVVMIAACTCFLAFSVLCLCCVSFVSLCHVAMPEVASASAQASGLLQVRALEDDADTHIRSYCLVLLYVIVLDVRHLFNSCVECK